MPWWKKALWWLLALVVVAFAVLYFTHNLPWQKKAVEEPVPENIEVVEPVEEPLVEVAEAPAAPEETAE